MLLVDGFTVFLDVHCQQCLLLLARDNDLWPEMASGREPSVLHHIVQLGNRLWDSTLQNSTIQAKYQRLMNRQCANRIWNNIVEPHDYQLIVHRETPPLVHHNRLESKLQTCVQYITINANTFMPISTSKTSLVTPLVD